MTQQFLSYTYIQQNVWTCAPRASFVIAKFGKQPKCSISSQRWIVYSNENEKTTTFMNLKHNAEQNKSDTK